MLGLRSDNGVDTKAPNIKLKIGIELLQKITTGIKQAAS
jgi:hypothetical protein